MNFKSDRKSLLRLLQTVSSAVAIRTTQQVLTGILLESQMQSIVATAYNLEVGIKEQATQGDDVCVEIVSDGSVVVPAKQLIDLMRKLPDDEINIEVASDSTVTVRSGHFECALHGMSGDTFPRLPTCLNAPKVAIPARVLKDLIRSTAFASSKSESRPVLTGVYVQFIDGNLRFSATDSLRLATRNTSIEMTETETFSVIIPSKSIIELTHILPDDDTEVLLTVTDSHCMFDMNTLQFHTRIIEGTFVDVIRLIPQTYVTELLVSTGDFIAAVDRAAVIAPRNQEVQLDVHEGATSIETKSPEFGHLTDVVLTKSTRGKDVRIAFNAKNVIEALRTFRSEETIVRLSGPNQPIVLMPSDEPGFVHVISPIITR